MKRGMTVMSFKMPHFQTPKQTPKRYRMKDFGNGNSLTAFEPTLLLKTECKQTYEVTFLIKPLQAFNRS